MQNYMYFVQVYKRARKAGLEIDLAVKLAETMYKAQNAIQNFRTTKSN